MTRSTHNKNSFLNTLEDCKVIFSKALEDSRIAIMDKGSIIAQDTPQQLILEYAPEPNETPTQGNIEDVFLALTGHGLRD